MNKNSTTNKTILALMTPLVLWAMMKLVIDYQNINIYNSFDLIITLDLLVIIPGLYFLLIQNTKIPKKTTILVMILGFLLGIHILPKSSQNYLEIFKNWILPFIELTILISVLYQSKRGYSQFKKYYEDDPDFYNSLKKVCTELLPSKLVLPLTIEFSVIYYGFIKWSKMIPKRNEYTYHTKSGTPALIYSFIFLIIIETLVVHILLSKWSIIAAWILTILSTYSAIQFLGFAKSLLYRPIVMNKSSVILKYGILSEVDIMYENIRNIENTKKRFKTNQLIQRLSPLGDLESHNIIIELNNEVQIKGLYGSKRTCKTVLLYIDEPKYFLQNINLEIKKSISFQ